MMEIYRFYKFFFILNILYWICAGNVLAGILLDEKSGQFTSLDSGTGYMIPDKDNKFIKAYDYVGNKTYRINGEFEKMRFLYLPRIMISFEDIEPINSQDLDYVMYFAEIQVDHDEYQSLAWEYFKDRISKKIPSDHVFAALTGVSFTSSIDPRIKVVGYEEDDENQLNLGMTTPISIVVPREKSDSFHDSLVRGKIPLFITFSFDRICITGLVDMIVQGSEKERIAADFGNVEFVTEKRFREVFNANFPRHSEYYFDKRISEGFTTKDYEEFERISLEKFGRDLFEKLLNSSKDIVISSRKEFEYLDIEFQETYQGYKHFFTDIWDLLHQPSDHPNGKSDLAKLLKEREFEKKIIFGIDQITDDELLENFKVSKDGKLLIDSKIIKSGKIRLVSKDVAAEEISKGFARSIPTSITEKVKETVKCEMKLGGDGNVEISVHFSYEEGGIRKNGFKKETCSKGGKSIKINFPKEYENVEFTGVSVKDKRNNNVEISPKDFRKDIFKSPLGWNLKLNTATINGEKRIFGVIFNWRG